MVTIQHTPAEVGLPPGFFLALPDEPTEKFRNESFSHIGHDFEDIVEFGIFMVSLMVYKENVTHEGRTSMMPTTVDIQDLYDAGYGMSIGTLYTYGGVGKLQDALGFYPDRSKPDKKALLERFRYLKDTAIPQDSNASITSLDDVLKWGAERDLIPSINVTHQAFEYDMLALRSLFGVERREVVRHGTYLKAFRLGAQVIAEHGRPIETKQLDAEHPEVFNGKTSRMLRYLFGTLTEYWYEYGWVPNSRGMKKEDLLNLGVRWAINHDGHIPSTSEINRLSAQQLYVSQQPLKNHFDGVKHFREEVSKAYQVYQKCVSAMKREGVDAEVIRVCSRRYDTSIDFPALLKDKKGVLQSLSDGSAKASWILKIMEQGFDLMDDEVLVMQIEDFVRSLKRRGISNDEDLRFIFSVIPRIHTDEGIKMAQDILYDTASN